MKIKRGNMISNELFDNYSFEQTGEQGKHRIWVYSHLKNKFLKPYYSTMSHKWRLKLKTKYGHFLQLSLQEIERIVFKNT